MLRASRSEWLIGRGLLGKTEIRFLTFMAFWCYSSLN